MSSSSENPSEIIKWSFRLLLIALSWFTNDKNVLGIPIYSVTLDILNRSIKSSVSSASAALCLKSDTSSQSFSFLGLHLMEVHTLRLSRKYSA